MLLFIIALHYRMIDSDWSEGVSEFSLRVVLAVIQLTDAQMNVLMLMLLLFL